MATAQKSVVFGKVTNVSGVPIAFVSVTVDTLKKAASCNEKGYYRIEGLVAGNYLISFTAVGYKTHSRKIVVSGNTTLNVSLEEETKVLNEVIITGKNEVQQVREQAFTVSSIDVKPLQNLNLDVNTVLNRTTGIRIRQSGGLGSDFSFSLNGFSGNQVRFFIDGIPSDYLGSAMRFNNIPVNVIDRIEVYKGVVPVNLGADALGGAVNIITSNNTKNFLDLSYSVGSFNTHQAALSSRATFKEKYVLNASGFFNYSDNNYPVDVPLVDKTTGKISDPQPIKLFNEGYRSASVMVEGGVVNTSWADRFLVGLIVSGNKKQIQRGKTLVLNPAGMVFRTDEGFTPTLKYQKKNLFIKDLSLNMSAIYSTTKAQMVDTSSRIYSWDQSYTLRQFGTTSGEISWYKTLFRFNDRAALNTATLEYTPNDQHTFSINNTFSYFRRKGSDPMASQYSESIAFTNPNILSKNITGLSYKYSSRENRWNATMFVKLFSMESNVRLQNNETGEYYTQKNSVVRHGEGIATTLFVMKDLQLKASYEYTARLPENNELFGDGLLLLSNLQLKPEQSHNANLGILYSHRFKNGHLLNAESGFIYRSPKNLIRMVATGVLSQYENMSSAQVLGGDLTIRYSYKHWINGEVNTTYQDMRNNNKTINSYADPLYLDRIPNIPYLFGNATLSSRSPEFGSNKLQIGINLTTMFVEKFYLNWPSQGSKDTKYTIPRQLSHDVSISLSALSGRYNISFSCINLADSKLYDNFKVQKPGRSFNLKFRTYLYKFRT